MVYTYLSLHTWTMDIEHLLESRMLVFITDLEHVLESCMLVFITDVIVGMKFN
jgi:hypothetical protein